MCVQLWGLNLICVTGFTVVTVGHLCQGNAAATSGKCSLYNVLIIQNRICEYGLETVIELEMSVNTTSCVAYTVCQYKLLLMWNAGVYRVAQ